MKRSAPMKRSGRVKARNAKRYAKNWTRAYGSPERVAWVQSLPCVGCGGGPSENAHAISGGKSRKADADTVAPLCRGCHTAYDQHREPFDTPDARALVIAAAAETERAWQRHLEERAA